MENFTASCGYSDGDIDTNRSDNPTLESLVAIRYSRRQALSGLGAAGAAFLGTSLLAACKGDGPSPTLVVTAGGTAQTTSGKAVVLSGQAGGSAQATSVMWEQVSGPTVTLTNAGTGQASFIAPSVSAPTPLVFRFTASGSGIASKSVESTITVDVAKLDFQAVPKNLNDVVTVPAGYTVTVLYRLGDPIQANVPAYANNGTDMNFAGRAGDHHDALYYFGLEASGSGRNDTNSSRGLLVMNHENITDQYLHANGPTGNGTTTPRPEAEAIKEIEAHGLSVIEVSRNSTGVWSYSQSSSFNRRITPNTPVTFNGPVRGNALLRTVFSPAGTDGRGTINNCANGHTPWGTDLTCEENWAGYFRRQTGDNNNRSAKSVTALNRYGISQGANGSYGWASVTPADAANTTYRRWNATVDAATAADGTGDFRNEPNQFGWVVEIDPYDPTKAPRKRTALGRMGHEGAWPGQFVAGRRPAFYLGDDSRGEYLYKFVSATPWSAADAQSADRLAIGDKYLDAGTLYVARFNADGTGTWLPLIFGQGPLTAANAAYAFQDQADVLTHARLAGDALGATKMDRPEWTATNPLNGEVYLTLTNNNATVRPLNGTDPANPRHYNDPRGNTNQFGNPNGHIIRLRENGSNTEATTFTWDIYLFGAGSDLNPTNINLSGLDASNDFSSPDGLWFARPTNPSGQVSPVLWIQTDDGAFTDQTNNQMLAAMPGQVGDGGPRTITNVGQSATAQQSTIVGKPATAATLKRFLVGPKECEITGVDSTPDGRTLFVNIQHPGELGTAAVPTSNWPQSQTGGTSGRPRSATIVITKDDGGVVGL